MWSGVSPDALRRAANTVALYGMRVPVEERVAIIEALYDQANKNEQQDDEGDQWSDSGIRARVAALERKVKR